MEKLPQRQVLSDVSTEGEEQQYLTFMVGGETYAIGILDIKEILEFGNVTHVPMMPDAVRGVINLRGSVVPVIDLAARFGGAPTEVTKRTCSVIVEIDVQEAKHDVGVMVDAVNEVMDIEPENIERAPSFGAKIRTDFIAGMGRIEDRFVILLDVAHVLSLEELSAIGDLTHREGLAKALPDASAE